MVDVVFVNYKIDISRNKHVRGLVIRDNRFYRFWGRMGCRLYFLPRGDKGWFDYTARQELQLCKTNGYLEIDVETIEKRWPEFRYEIDSYFMLKELANA